MQPTSNPSLSPSELRASLDLVEIKPGVKFSRAVLKDLLPDVETALFFGAVYELDYTQLSSLLVEVLDSDLAKELFKGNHSTELQDYLVNELTVPADVNIGKVVFSKKKKPKGKILPDVWKSLEIEVAQSITDVAAKLKDVIGIMPGKQGKMVFRSLMKMNARRPVLGDYRAQVVHPPLKDNLVILDVSGSMTADTIRNIIKDVVALSYMANAHLAVVSNTTTLWTPGAFNVKSVLKQCEFGGTQYETLHPLFKRDWGVVVTIADYDGSPSAKQSLRQKCGGHIEQVVDISLVNRPTFLAECAGQFASEVRPMLIARTFRVIGT